jgi:hypothetical protein
MENLRENRVEDAERPGSPYSDSIGNSTAEDLERRGGPNSDPRMRLGAGYRLSKFVTGYLATDP